MVLINGYKIADMGFYINLDYRTDRKSKLEDQFTKYSITGVERHQANQSSTSGPRNCRLSHYEVYEKFLDTKFELLLVLEDDCLFLPHFYANIKTIQKNIFSQEFDLFWLGCRNRRSIKPYSNHCYQVQSVSHAQAYLINKKLCQYILNTFPKDGDFGLAIDELLCLLVYSESVARDPQKYDFYQLDNPLENLSTNFISLCYESALTTQYSSYSDLWHFDSNVESYIISSYPVVPHETN